MIESLYQSLMKIGYTHPLHPALTHLPIGLILGGFIFCLIALIFKRYPFFQASRYCLVLSLCVAPFTITAGLLDWQYYYGGKWPVPIIMKLIFAVLLLVVAGYATHFSFKEENKMSKTLFLYAISAVLVISLGYFGGDLVYGTKVAPTESADTQPDSADSQIDGAHLFDNNCSQCHYLDKQDVKTGPSLQGLFKMDKLPVSGFPVSDETVYKQIKTPYKNMPAFDKLTEEEIREIIDYLKTV